MSNNSSNSGVGCMSVIFLILLILKLFGIISISWWWVCAPLFMDLGFWFFVLVGLFIAWLSKITNN